ncbi:MAG: leucine-rich repeat domain-containing protein [Treponema sp.]|nr:leucine-rich repeat domain-containing protein [Treponema sp.]
MPAAITSIGNRAFTRCAALTTVNLPAVTSIGPLVFSFPGGSGVALTVTLGSAVPTLGYTMFNIGP